MVLGLKVFSSRARDFAEEMSTEGMIPGIKLFGRKILAPERHIPADSDAASAFPTASQATNVCCAISNGESEKAENSVKSLAARTAEKDRQNLDPDNDDNDEQEKTFKKPDKIVPCPRCNSFDTKFCYFNNYNVNQPRHFCKNCQRYWTAGGTMRNVPIGAGRRKNKQFASQYRFNANGAPTNNVESPDTTNHHLLFPPGGLPSSETIKGTVLKFGPDTCLSESVENTLHLKEQQHKVEEEAVSGKSSSSCSEQEKMVSSVTYDYNHDPPFHPLQHQQIPALFFPWTGLAANVSSFQWCSSSMVAIPGPLNVPLQIVAAPCVGGVPLYPSGAGNVPLALFNGSHCLPSSTSNNGFPPTLGKHLRDPNAADGGILERSALVPKVPRVDGPTEASKGPLRTPLHIEPHEKVSSLYGAVDATGSGSKGEGSGIESVL